MQQPQVVLVHHRIEVPLGEVVLELPNRIQIPLRAVPFSSDWVSLRLYRNKVSLHAANNQHVLASQGRLAFWLDIILNGYACDAAIYHAEVVLQLPAVTLVFPPSLHGREVMLPNYQEFVGHVVLLKV